jgi:hypothetical protein
LSFYITQFGPDRLTIRTLAEYERAILSLKAYAAAGKLTSPTVVAVLATLLLAQAVLRRRITATSNAPGAIWTFVKATQVLVRRVYVALLVVASFSFFGLRTDGPAAQLEALLRGAKRDYTRLRSNVAVTFDTELRGRVYERAWHDAPPPLQAGVLEEQAYAKQRAQLRLTVINADADATTKSKAESVLRTLTDGRVRLEDTISKWNSDLPREAPTVARDLPVEIEHLSPAAVRRAFEVSDGTVRRVTARVPPEWMTGLEGDLAKKLLSMPFSATYIPAIGPVVAAIRSEYPLLGEVIGAAEGALADTLFHKVKSQREQLVAEAIRSERNAEIVAAAVAAIAPFSWRSVARGWQPHVANELREWEGSIRTSRQILDVAVRRAPPVSNTGTGGKRPAAESLGVQINPSGKPAGAPTQRGRLNQLPSTTDQSRSSTRTRGTTARPRKGGGGRR